MSRRPLILTPSEATAFERGASAELRRYLSLEPKNEAQELCLLSADPILVLTGPNTIGKSPIFASRLTMHSTGWLPHWVRDRGLITLPRQHRGRFLWYIVLSISREQAEGAAWGTLAEWFPPEFKHESSTKYRYVLRQFVDEPGRVGCPRIIDRPGGVLPLRTTGQKRKAHQGNPRVKVVWADEEDGNDAVIDEQVTMLSKTGGWFQMSCTPVESLEKGGRTWFAQELLGPARAARREPGQRAVRLDHRTMVVFGRRGDQVSSVTGRLMTDAELRDLDGSFKTEAMRALRVDGELIIAPERPFFDEGSVRDVGDHMRTANEHPRRGRLIEQGGEVRFLADPDGMLYVFEDFDPRDCCCIGADASSGNAEDWTAFVVWSRRHGRVVAVFHGRIDPHRSRHALRLLMLYYGKAPVCPERGPYERELIGYLRDRGLGHLVYRAESPSTSTKHKVLDYGYVTSGPSRTALDQRLAAELDRRRPMVLRYQPLLDEIAAYGFYGRVDHGRDVGDHPPQGHDDCQKALSLALVCHDAFPMPRDRTPADIAFDHATGFQRLLLDHDRRVDAVVREARKAEEFARATALRRLLA